MVDVGATGGGAPGGRSGDARFLGTVPDVYERLMVPMIFEAAAVSLAGEVAVTHPRTVLETAAGTGALTRALLRACRDATITATDLNPPMLERAAARTGQESRVTWQQADALDLPFDDHVFDAVACQFGVMFFPDRVRGHLEARRVLRPGGWYHFNVWDRIENNEVPAVIAAALAQAVPDHPVDFMARTPHGYFEEQLIRSDLERAGFEEVVLVAMDGTSRTTAAEAAVAFCQGTPLRAEIEDHPTLDVEEATRVAREALLAHYGTGPVEAPIRSFQVRARSSG